ncbi:MAG: 4Fe-4S dicluster domain-containing protein [Thermodesulfobacteriota bacterium]
MNKTSPLDRLRPRISGCLQCGRCSAGCPRAFVSPHTPRQVIRLLQWGLVEEAARSPFLQQCRLCGTCAVRCPQGLDVAGTMLRLVWERFFLYNTSQSHGHELAS